LSGDGQATDRLIDGIIETWDQLLYAGDWPACSHALLAADADHLPPPVSLSILSMALAERERLRPAYDDLLGRVRRRLVGELGEQAAAENLYGLD